MRSCVTVVSGSGDAKVLEWNILRASCGSCVDCGEGCLWQMSGLIEQKERFLG